MLGAIRELFLNKVASSWGPPDKKCFNVWKWAHEEDV